MPSVVSCSRTCLYLLVLSLPIVGVCKPPGPRLPICMPSGSLPASAFIGAVLCLSIGATLVACVRACSQLVSWCTVADCVAGNCHLVWALHVPFLPVLLVYVHGPNFPLEECLLRFPAAVWFWFVSQSSGMAEPMPCPVSNRCTR